MENLVTEIAKTFRQIIYRDLFYVISGLLIANYSREYLPIFFDFGNTKNNIFLDVAYAGFLLSIGLVNQEFWSQSHLITTSINKPDYNWALKKIYQRHTWKIWVRSKILKKILVSDDWDKELWLRVIDLKQIGSSMASCNATLFLIALFAYFNHSVSIMIPISHFFGTLIFSMLCWTKVMQQAAFEFDSIMARDSD